MLSGWWWAVGCGDQIDCDKQELVVSDNSLSCLPAQIATLSSLSYLRLTLNTPHGLLDWTMSQFCGI